MGPEVIFLLQHPRVRSWVTGVWDSALCVLHLQLAGFALRFCQFGEELKPHPRAASRLSCPVFFPLMLPSLFLTPSGVRSGEGNGNSDQTFWALPELMVTLVCLAGRLHSVPQHRRGRNPPGRTAALGPVFAGGAGAAGELTVMMLMVPAPPHVGENPGPGT